MCGIVGLFLKDKSLEPQLGVVEGRRRVIVADVRVAELDEVKRLAGAHAVVVSGRWRPTWPT